MKCTVEAGILAAALAGPCARAKPSNTIAILKHVKLEAADARLTILGHDMDSSSEAAVAADVIEPGAMALPAEPLLRLVAGLPKFAAVTFDLDGTICAIKSGRSRYKLPALDAADMPPPLVVDGGYRATVSAADLDQLFIRARPALSLKASQIVCHGLHIHSHDGKLSSAGTSGYTLMRFSTEVAADDFAGVIVPRTATDEIVKVGAGELAISDRAISITANGRTYASKLIAEKYPDLSRQIPDLTAGKIVIDRDATLECLQRLGSIGSFIDSDLVDITASGADLSFSMLGTADGAETVECEAEGRAFVCLRSSQLVEALKSMRGERLHLYITGTKSPFRVYDPAEPSAVSVVMPCQTKNTQAVAA
jgi:DNA polymerase-3 subunit beta